MINSVLNNRLNSQRNKSVILNLVRMCPGIPRARIAKLLNLSPTAITDLVNDLLDQNLVTEGGSSESKRGRRPVKLEISKGKHFFLTVHFDAKSLRAAVMDLNGDILGYSIKKGNIDDPLDSRMETLNKSFTEALENSGIGWDKIQAIGCGISEYVDPLKGLVPFGENIPSLQDVPIKEIIEKKYGIPCYVNSSPHLLALAEKYYGKARGVRNFVYLNVGEGISLGIFAGGSLYLGENGAAGEIGHIPVVADGPQCNCGKVGCLESVASSSKITEFVLSSLNSGVRSSLKEKYLVDPKSITAEDIAVAAENGDLLAYNAIRKTAGYIAKVLVSVLQVLNPEMLIMGGPLFRGGEVLLKNIENEIKHDLLPYISNNLKIEVSALDYDRSFLLGALIVISEKHWAPDMSSMESEKLAEEFCI